MKKKVNKEIKICKLCQKEITPKDNYCRLTEYREDVEISNGYYHTQCFRDRFMNFKEIQDRANKILGVAGPMMQRLQAEGRV